MRASAEKRPNNRPACRSGRRRPSPALESPGNRAHHTKSPATFTAAELGESTLLLRRHLGLGWNLGLVAVRLRAWGRRPAKAEDLSQRNCPTGEYR
ncbi:hypothetical protein NDU88_004954 [Pleurodeles waltl]|uniref:Uncharacterized protein n=1 Tax=Pleurodeles waltl TaxID=8319 RepID=A0AAV7MWL8_PLEWA|nr:hypothetical protein NDU88_004954 [Pleurodeles waltl]